MAPTELPLKLDVTEEQSQRLLGSQRWLNLAVCSLLLSGILAFVLVLARLPLFAGLFDDPLWPRRCLVVHVNLALGVWLYAFIASMYYRIPLISGRSDNFFTKNSVVLGACGVLLFVLSGNIRGVKPILSNYIPSLDHPLFLIGMGTFGFAVAVSFCNSRLFSKVDDVDREQEGNLLGIPVEAVSGLRTAALAFIFGLATLWASWLNTDPALEAKNYYELLFWGAGHVFQIASVAGMVAVWIALVYLLTGKSPVTRKWSAFLFGLLLLPALFAPLLAINGTDKVSYYVRFTMMMMHGIWPVVTVFMVCSIRTLYKNWDVVKVNNGVGKTPYFWGIVASFSLTIAGFILGSQISGSNTLIPGHYHAAIGAVTVSFMTMAYYLLGMVAESGLTRKKLKTMVYQPVIFGFGQTIFALGFGFAGIQGAARKTYGAEVHVRSVSEYIGLGVMGIGGLIAVIAGIMFLWLVVSRIMNSHSGIHLFSRSRRREDWERTRNIPSKS